MRLALLLLTATALHAAPAEPHVLARLGEARFRLQEPAAVLTYSPDGQRLASWDGKEVVVWSADGVRQRAFRLAKGAEVKALAFTPDVRLLAAVVVGPNIRLMKFDPATGTIPSNRLVAQGRADVVFAPDASRLVVYRKWDDPKDDGRTEWMGLRCFATATGKELWGDPSPKELRMAVFRPDGGAVLVGEAAGPLREYAADTGFPGRAFQVRELYPTGLAYSPDGKFVYGSAALPWDGCLFCWDLAAEKLAWVETCREVRVVGLLDGGRVLLGRGSGDVHSSVNRWHRRDPATGRAVGEPVTPEPEAVTAYTPHPDGKSVAVATADRRIVPWDLMAGRPAVAAVGPATPVMLLHTTAGGSKVRGWAGQWYEWDVKTGAQAIVPEPTDGLPNLPIAVSADGRWVARLTQRDKLTSSLDIVEVASGRVQTIRKNFAPERCQFVAGDRLVTEYGTAVTVHDVKTGRVLMDLDLRSDDRVVAPDGSAVMAFWRTENDTHGTRWDLRTGWPTAAWTATDPGLAGGTLGPRGETLIVSRFAQFEGDEPRTLVFDAATGKRLGDWADPPPQIRSGFRSPAVAYRPDHRSFLTYTLEPFQFTIREIATGGVRDTVRYRRPVSDWSFTPDGRAFLVSTRAHPVEIWSAVDPGGKWKAKAEAELWDALADPDAAKGYTAIRHLWAHPTEAVAFLQARVTLPAAPPAEWVAGRIAKLDAARFRDREQATADLLAAGEAVGPALRAARPAASTEARERIDGLLAKVPTAPARLRPIRVCEVVEGLGTPAATDLLRAWAKADAATTLGREARASVERVTRR